MASRKLAQPSAAKPKETPVAVGNSHTLTYAEWSGVMMWLQVLMGYVFVAPGATIRCIKAARAVEAEMAIFQEASKKILAQFPENEQELTAEQQESFNRLTNDLMAQQATIAFEPFAMSDIESAEPQAVNGQLADKSAKIMLNLMTMTRLGIIKE